MAAVSEKAKKPKGLSSFGPKKDRKKFLKQFFCIGGVGGGGSTGSNTSNTSNASWLEALTSQCENGSTGMLCGVRAGRILVRDAASNARLHKLRRGRERGGSGRGKMRRRKRVDYA